MAAEPATLRPAAGQFPAFRSVLAVCAHPDDESFGLGAVLSTASAAAARTSVLCFTRGEASTLGTALGLLAEIRRRELRRAAVELGVGSVRALTFPDGGLQDIPLARLVQEIRRQAAAVQPDVLLVFDEGGITGHPDHRRATEAALALAEQAALPVLAWALPGFVAATLNAEFGTAFVGREEHELDLAVSVDRARQRRAIGCHLSQSTNNPVLWRRLELLGPQEWLRYLRR